VTEEVLKRARSTSPVEKVANEQTDGWGGADLGKDAGLIPGRETVRENMMAVHTPETTLFLVQASFEPCAP
jgi:hypothetical protein